MTINFEFLYTNHDLETIFGKNVHEKIAEVEEGYEEGFEGDKVLVEYHARLEALTHAADTFERIINFVSDMKDNLKDTDFDRSADALLRDIEHAIARCNDPEKYHSY